jgi:adenylate cyclase
MSPGVVSLGVLAFTLWALGYPGRALDVSLEGIALAEKLAYPPGLAMAQVYACGTHGFCGDWAKVRELAEATLVISEEHGLPYWYTAGLVNRGRALVHQGEIEDGIAGIEHGIDESREMGAEAFTVLQLTMLAEACLEAGLFREGLTAAEEALEIARRTGERFFASEAWRLKGECLSETVSRETSRSDAAVGEVQSAFLHALALAQEQKARSLQLRAAMSLCGLERRQGRSRENDRLLADLYHSFDEGHDTSDLREARSLLGIP